MNGHTAGYRKITVLPRSGRRHDPDRQPAARNKAHVQLRVIDEYGLVKGDVRAVVQLGRLGQVEAKARTRDDFLALALDVAGALH